MTLTIVLNENPDGKVGIQLEDLTEIVEKIRNSAFDKIVFDFKNIGFINTTLVLGLSVIISELDRMGKSIDCINQNASLSEYLAIICFPFGLIPENTSNWAEIMNRTESKTYLPVINFSTELSDEKVIIRNDIIGQFVKLLSNKFGFGVKVRTGISYFISEYTDNIVEHSGVSRGRLFYQYYPNKGYVEISIIDCGKTILGSYMEKDIQGIENDKNAIESALSGLSTKGKERGRGIRTSNSLIVEGMLGKVFLVSGKAMYINTGQSPLILPIKKWKGTILTIIIPNVIPESIEIYDFIT